MNADITQKSQKMPIQKEKITYFSQKVPKIVKHSGFYQSTKVVDYLPITFWLWLLYCLIKTGGEYFIIKFTNLDALKMLYPTCIKWVFCGNFLETQISFWNNLTFNHFWKMKRRQWSVDFSNAEHDKNIINQFTIFHWSKLF